MDHDRDAGASRRRRHRRDRSRSPSVSAASSRSRSRSRSHSRSRSRSRDDRKRHRHSGRRRHHRRHRRHRGDESQAGGSSSSDAAAVAADEPPLDWGPARSVLASLLDSLPQLAPELRGVLEMLDAGEALVVDGIADPLARAGLVALCASLGMDEVVAAGDGDDGDEPTTMFAAPARVREAGLVRNLGDMLPPQPPPAPPLHAEGDAVSAGGPGAPQSSAGAPSQPSASAAALAAPPPHRAQAVRGPARPTDAQLSGRDEGGGNGGDGDGDGGDDDDDVGPLLPDDPRAVARADRMAAAQRGCEAAASADAAAALRRAKASNGVSKRDGQHDAWMSLPSDELFGDAGDAPGNRYATKAAPNAGIGWSYLAKEAPAAAEPAAAGAAAAGKSSSGSQRYMADVASARGGSLVDQYARASSAKAAPAAPTAAAAAAPRPPPPPAERRPFDRERDLQRPRQVRDPGVIVEKAAALASRFGAGKFERSFL